MLKKKKEGKPKKPTALIVGGTTGLGRELVELMKKDFTVTLTGRKVPMWKIDGTGFWEFVISHDIRDSDFDTLCRKPWDTVVYCAGAYQEGLIDSFHKNEIQCMNNLCLTVPEMLVSRIVSKYDDLRQLVLVSSTSALKPRKLEPLYSAGKAGLHMLGRCLAEDERIGSVVLAAPCGMDTSFYENADRDTSKFAKAGDVAERIYAFMRDRTKFIELRFERTDEEPYYKCWQEHRTHSNPSVPYLRPQ